MSRINPAKLTDSTDKLGKTLNGSVSRVKEQQKVLSSHVAKKAKKHHHTVLQVGILGVVAGLLILGNVSADTRQPYHYLGGLGGGSTVDELSSAQVAANIARGGNLLVQDNVQNLADSLTASVDFATTDDNYLAKPQVVATDARTRHDIRTYVTKEGESVSSVAAAFNVTSDTIRWANDLTGNALGAGTELRIPPVSGIVYTVEAGDTIGGLAQRYNANAEQIIVFNDLEISGLAAGVEIVIPDGRRTPAPTTYFASASTGGGFAFGSQPLYGGNGYSYGYCTWHVANRRAQIGKPIPRNLGNAVTWASLAARAGLPTGGGPQVGSILWHKNTYIAGGLGHVGFVETVNPDGSVVVSDMNFPIWGGVTQRTIAANETANYVFID